MELVYINQASGVTENCSHIYIPFSILTATLIVGFMLVDPKFVTEMHAPSASALFCNFPS